MFPRPRDMERHAKKGSAGRIMYKHIGLYIHKSRCVAKIIPPSSLAVSSAISRPRNQLPRGQTTHIKAQSILLVVSPIPRQVSSLSYPVHVYPCGEQTNVLNSPHPLQYSSNNTQLLGRERTSNPSSQAIPHPGLSPRKIKKEPGPFFPQTFPSGVPALFLSSQL